MTDSILRSALSEVNLPLFGDFVAAGFTVKMALAVTILGIMGNLTAMGLFLSPLPTFWRILRRKSTEEFSALPYALTVFNCILWTFYGTPMVANALLIVTVNGIGLFIESIYMLMFLIFANNRKTRLQVIGMIASVASVFGAVAAFNLALIPQHSKRTDVVGILCVIVTTSMYASPLSITKKVISTKSTEFMPFWLSFFTFLNGSCWVVYSIAAGDVFVLIPNLFGAILGTVQVILYGWYSRSRNDKRTHPKEIASDGDDQEKKAQEKGKDAETENDIEKNLPQTQ